MEPITAIEKRTKEEQAEISAYRIPEGFDNAGNLYVPGIAVQTACVNAGSYSKGKGRATLAKIVAACLFIDPEYLDLKTTKYAIDSRPVVIKATGGRIVRHRPRLNEWSVELTASYDDELLMVDQLRTVFNDMGTRVGLLDFRPAHKGPFGRCRVDLWEPLD
jgi:hypothetical protein